MYKIDAEVVCSSKVDDETLILNLDTGFYYTLDVLGGAIWERLLENQDRGQIVAAIVSDYDVKPEEAEKDFQDLLLHLETEGLIQKV